MENNATIIALSGKGGVGKTSVSAAIVKLLVEAYPDKKILAIDADPAVGLSTALGIDVKITIDDIRKEIVETVEDGQTRAAIELLGDARYKIFLSESSLVKEGLFLVIFRNCRFSPSMMLVVYIILRTSAGYAKNVERISQFSSQLLTQLGYVFAQFSLN